MKKIFKFIKTFIFVLTWLILCSFLEKYWKIFHWEYIFLKIRFVFDYLFWFTLKKLLFNFDVGYYLEEIVQYASYEIPKEGFKYIPIFFIWRNIWKKR